MSKELLRDAIAVMETLSARSQQDMSASDRAVIARMQADIDTPEQEPFGWYSAKHDEFMLHLRKTEHERLGSYTSKVGGFSAPLYAKPQPVSDTDCTRSHPHENMRSMCELRTEIARLKFEARQPATDLTDDEIVKIAIASRGAEPGRDGYILPVTFARAILAAQKAKL